MAKSVEDTAFYTYVRFVALNEVGGAPDRFGTTIADLHAANDLRRRQWPRTMTCTSTHDTKRGEDVRARLAVLSEVPDLWEMWVRGWLTTAESHSTTIDDERAPSQVDQYLFFQTVVGAFPLDEAWSATEDFADRVHAYALKAAREAKPRTSWLSPNEAHEKALEGFVRGMLADPAFAKSLDETVDLLASHGASNGLAQLLLRMASPGAGGHDPRRAPCVVP